MNIYIYDINTISEIAIDGANLLSLILSNGIRLKGNLDTFLYNDVNTSFEVYCQNLINCTYDYLNNKEIKGFNIEEKIEIVKSVKFETNKLYLLINVIIFIIIFTLSIWLNIKLYHIEKDFLFKLIMFRTNNFDLYLQYLDELKKKLKNVSEDDEKSDEENESNPNNLDEKNENKTLEIASQFMKNKTFENIKLEKKKLNSNDENHDNSNLRAKIRKKGRFSKFLQQKREKLEIMGNYFIIYNIFFCIKVCGIVFIVMTNYLIVYLINMKKRDEFFSLDNKMNDIIGILKDNYLTYSYFKREIYKFTLYEYNKSIYIKQLQDGIIENVTINNITYIQNDIEKLNSSIYNYDMETLNNLKMRIKLWK